MKRSFLEPERELAANFLSYLRALSWLYQVSHWQCKGPFFYQDHLLFQRLYESVEKEIDGVAEKMVLSYGEMTVEAPDTVKRMSKILQDIWECPDPIQRGILGEALLRGLLDEILEDENLPTGWRVLIEDIYNKHEENQYLLKQRSQPPSVLERNWFGNWSTVPPEMPLEQEWFDEGRKQ